MTHELKIKQEYAQTYLAGKKRWELRKMDREFKIGDTIVFFVLETGFSYSAQIEYIFAGGQYGLAGNYCILSLSFVGGGINCEQCAQSVVTQISSDHRMLCKNCIF